MTSNNENMTNSQGQKTALRKRLEELESEIYNSWLKDQDKVKELLELSGILEGIYKKDAIEDYFESQGDFDYFCRKFSHETINNILKQHMVFGPNGDEVALNVLFYYLRIFYKFMEKPQYQILWESVKEIFDSSKNYYKGTIYGSTRNINEKKLLSAEKYNEMKMQKKNEARLEISQGMMLDICIDNKKVTGQMPERKIWVRGRVERIETEYFVAYCSEDPFPIFLKFNSFEYAPLGSMTKDWDFRQGLKPWDNIDCYDRGRYLPATVLHRKEEEVNGLKHIEYRIGFRVYPEAVQNWEQYKVIWPQKDLARDTHGRVYFGDVENLDEWISFFSKRIQEFHSVIFSEKTENSEGENYFIDEMVKFVDEKGRKTYIVGRTNGFYYYFALMINYFCELGGFEKMINSLSQKGEEKPNSDLIHNIFYILNVASGLFHKQFIIELGKNLYDNIFTYLNDMNQNELRNIKKDTFDLILKVLKFYLGLSLGASQRNEIIEKFSINFAIKMIKTTFLDKRITAIKTLIDVIKAAKSDPSKRASVLKLVEENQIFYEIYGSNSHIQLINKSKDLLEIMLQEDRLSDGEMDLIWGATKKGDLEGKLTILKTLKEISKSLQPKHITVLLNNIYSEKNSELINDEIDLIYELSTHSSQSEETLDKCIKFFTSCLLESRSDEGEKVEILIGKIFEITKFNPSFKSSVINMTLSCLEKNENVNLALKILQKYLKDSDLSTDYDLNRLLVENENLANSYSRNFTKYIAYVKEKSKNWNGDIDTLPLRDHFNHSQNLKSRLNFLNILLTLKLWKKNEDPIEFVYKTLIEEGEVSEKDKFEFFNWIKSAIEKNVDYETEEKIFKLFNTKLCNDTKSCQHLSIEAFDTYLKVFLDINSQNNHLKYSKIPREEGIDLDVFVQPESLIGFGILWKIVFESFSHDIMNKGIATLHSIFTNVQIVSNENISNTSISYSQLLLQKCLDLIKVTESDTKSTMEEKRNIITKCLIVLRLMVEESEKRGTARIKSHSGILKKKIINVKVTSSCGFYYLRDFSLKLYGNTTIWELKELISHKLKYCFDFLRIFIKKDYELKSTDHGKTILDMNIEEGDEIRCSSNGLEKMIPQEELHVDNVPTQTVINIFSSWFDEFNTNGLMTREDCSKFIRVVTNCREDIGADDHRINFLFGTYDKNKDDLLEREEFMQFYIECASKADKRKTVWENMRAMGVRNDLKKISEPYAIYNDDKTVLPRYQLSHNEDFFNTVFYLQDLNEQIAKEAFNFLCIICTNPNIYSQILSADDKTDWNTLLNESNIYKLIYSLQIIESFIEDIEMDSQNVDTLEEIQDSDNQKVLWMKNFVEKGGYTHLVNILQKKLLYLVDSLKKKEILNNALMNNLCIQFLLKIVKIFYFSSLNKFESYKKTLESLNKNFANLNLNTNTKENEIEIKRERSDSLRKANSAQFDSGALDVYFVNGGLGELILNSFDHSILISNLISLTYNLTVKETKTKEDIDIISISFEFLTVIIPFAPQSDKAENIIIENNNFVDICLYGLLNASNETRNTFSNALIKFSKFLQNNERFKVLYYLFKNIFSLIENISKDLEKNSNELFEFFSYLLEIYLNDAKKFASDEQPSEVDPKKFLRSMLENLEADIQEDGEKSKVVNLSNELFIGYLKIVTKVAENNVEVKKDISNNYSLISGILTKVLFKQNTQELKEKLSTLDFVNPDKIDDSKSNRNSNQQIRNVCYNFILSMLKGSIDNFEKFFSVNVLESDTKKEEKNEKVSKYYYSNMGRNEEHVGLKNLGCICYMNAMMQQFFMVPTLRYALLRTDDKVAPDLSNVHNVDDNSFHQVQRMFSFLELTERMDYNPFGFCFSFKDWEGNPTNTSIQQDSQEFLSRFLDVMENQIKPTPSKYIFNSVFGGKTCTVLTCEQGCGTASTRFEDFYTLSLEVNNMKTLSDSLEKLITPEKIDDYDCSTCKRKVQITKRNLLASLPNVMIVHLQRLFYNYELDRNEKINSRLDFPKVLNLKDYCLEEVMRRNAAKKAKESDSEESQVNETDEVYFKHHSYYEYHLVGVVVHMGSAEAGHYYSYINSVRGGNENEAYFNPKEENHMNSWLEFNDSYISKFNVQKLEDECYGGSYDNDQKSENAWSNFNRGEKTKSAYMLVYERRIKSPIKIVLEKVPEDTSKLITFKEEEGAQIRKKYDLSRYIDTPEYNTVKSSLFSSVFFDVHRNEYFTYKPFYTKERLIPQKYYLEIMEDNSLFQKHQNISDERFVSFFDNVINLLDDAMNNLQEISEETSEKISITFMNFIFNILSHKDKHQLLGTAKEKFLHIINSQPNCIHPVWDYINKNQKGLSDILSNENENVVLNNCELIYALIKKAYESNSEEFLAALNKNTYEENTFSYVKKTIVFLLSLFPRIPNRLLSRTGPILKLIRAISLISESILEYFANREVIFVFITFMLGRESPCYNETLVKPGENWDYGRGQLSGFEPIVEMIYEIFVKSKENKLGENLLYSLSARDIKCLKNPTFLKFIFKNCEKVFTNLLVNLNYNDVEFTLQSCVEITKYIDEMYTFNGADFVKLLYAILPLLSLKDSFQRMRFEIVIGLPQLIIEEPRSKYPFPLVGFHNCGDERSKYVDLKGAINLRNMCSVLKKTSLLKSKETFSVQIFLAIIEACAENFELLKYFRKIPAEEPIYESFIEYGVALVSSYGRNESNPFYVKLRTCVDEINPNLDKVMGDPEILPGSRGFIGRYLLKDIKREEISLIAQKENLFLFQAEYFANWVPITAQMDFSDSVSYLGSIKNIDEDEKVQKEKESPEVIDEENLKDLPIDVHLMSTDVKAGMTEKEFLKKIIPLFTNVRKVIVENPNSVPNSTSLLKRYFVFNNNQRDANIDFKIKRLSTPIYEDINEYIPSSCLSLFVPSNMVKSVYVLPKLFPEKEWCDIEHLEYEFDVELSKPANYTYYNNAGNYGGVSNAPSVEYYNYTNHATYSRRDNNYQAGYSAGYQQQYPSLDTDYQQIGAGNQVSEADDEEDYGVNY